MQVGDIQYITSFQFPCPTSMQNSNNTSITPVKTSNYLIIDPRGPDRKIPTYLQTVNGQENFTTNFHNIQQYIYIASLKTKYLISHGLYNFKVVVRSMQSHDIVCGCGCVCVCVCVHLPCLYFRGPSYDNTTTHRGLYTFRGPKNGSSENTG